MIMSLPRRTAGISLFEVYAGKQLLWASRERDKPYGEGDTEGGLGQLPRRCVGRVVTLPSICATSQRERSWSSVSIGTRYDFSTGHGYGVASVSARPESVNFI